MRKIEFRGFSNLEGAWVIGQYFMDEKRIGTWHYIRCVRDYQIMPGSIGQFTGFKDMYKTKIYEGDILDLNEELYVVSWNSAEAMFELSSGSVAYNFGQLYEYEVEIVGNFYQDNDMLSE